MQGWVKLHRRLADKAIWQQSTPEQKTILVTLLLMANHQEKQWFWNGNKFEAKPGQFVTSLASIKQKSGRGISTQNVRGALEKFRKLDFLTYESTKTGRLVTVLNWGKYQVDVEEGNKDANKEVTKSQQRGNKEVTTNKNVKNVKNDKKKQYAPAVTLTPDQYQKLLDRFGEKQALDRIERLSLYKKSKGKKYKCDYSTILSWARKDEIEGSVKNGGVFTGDKKQEPGEYESFYE